MQIQTSTIILGRSAHSMKAICSNLKHNWWWSIHTLSWKSRMNLFILDFNQDTWNGGSNSLVSQVPMWMEWLRMMQWWYQNKTTAPWIRSALCARWCSITAKLGISCWIVKGLGKSGLVCGWKSLQSLCFFQDVWRASTYQLHIEPSTAKGRVHSVPFSSNVRECSGRRSFFPWQEILKTNRLQCIYFQFFTYFLMGLLGLLNFI